jgi:hypothetical protein
MPVPVVVRLVQAVPMSVFDAVLAGALAPEAAARVDALTVLAVAGAAPDLAARHVDAALAGAGYAPQELR